MWLRSIGIVMIAFSSGQVVARGFTQPKPGSFQINIVVLGIAIFVGLICMLIGGWLEMNKFAKSIKEIQDLLDKKLKG